jgi:hypothetical protein
MKKKINISYATQEILRSVHKNPPLVKDMNNFYPLNPFPLQLILIVSFYLLLSAQSIPFPSGFPVWFRMGFSLCHEWYMFRASHYSLLIILIIMDEG